MTAKEYLEQVVDIDTRIKTIDDNVREQKLKLNTLSAIDYSKDVVQTSKITDVSDLIVGIEEYIANQSKEKERLIELKSEVTNTINKVRYNILSALLIRKYVMNETWDAIAIDIDKSETLIRKTLHAQALGEVEKILSGNYRKLPEITESYQILPP